MVSLFAFVMTAYGMNPYLIASFNSGFACENGRTQILAAALEQRSAGSTIYPIAPQSLRCIATPGLVAAGVRPLDTSPAAKPRPVAQPGKPAQKR